MSKTIEKFTFGVGDRFAHQAGAQLEAFVNAKQAGVPVYPVWNKSNREHLIVGSEPASLREAAESAIKDRNWDAPWYIDADHINLDTVDGYLDCSDFFTLDVADWIGEAASDDEVASFVNAHPELVGEIKIPHIDEPFVTSKESIENIAAKYLRAVAQAGEIYRKIETAKGIGNFITEVSMDETDSPQTPPELLVILVALSDQGVPAQTIAPKFTGRFNKGVDYVGDLDQFEKEFRDDLAVIAYAIEHYGLPESLKLSVHSGSDKFAIYAPIRRALADFDAGLHLKTAGTTWLEEVIGLAEAGGDGLEMAKAIYAKALEHMDDLCAPYATVIDIDRLMLPAANEVSGWSSEQFVSVLRHDQQNPDYNPHLRQLLHVGFKIAAKMGSAYTDALKRHEKVISKNVTDNIFERHIKPLFLGE